MMMGGFIIIIIIIIIFIITVFTEKMDGNGWLFCLITATLCLAHLVDAQGKPNPKEQSKRFSTICDVISEKFPDTHL